MSTINQQLPPTSLDKNQVLWVRNGDGGRRVILRKYANSAFYLAAGAPPLLLASVWAWSSLTSAARIRRIADKPTVCRP